MRQNKARTNLAVVMAVPRFFVGVFIVTVIGLRRFSA